MGIYFYWGEDSFRLQQAVQALRDRLLDQAWVSFNYEKLPGDQTESTQQALSQVLTLPFGGGDRLVWLANTHLGQRCSADLLEELSLTLPHIPPECHLLLTSSQKPDGRSKVVKLLQKHGQFQEFSPIPPWKTEELETAVVQAAKTLGVNLSAAAVELLAEAVGNDTRQLHNELEKLRLYAGSTTIQPEQVAALVTVTTQNSLRLASTILAGDRGTALELLSDLLRQNEPPLRLMATLTRQFRTWLWVKLLTSDRERDNTVIARLADVGNPKRIYFIQKEIKNTPLAALKACLPTLLNIESQLKQGRDAEQTLTTGIIRLCLDCSS
ncbi:DNA polymerase III subunit delta [Candidatus Synechococcus calcipolaris G9]|uniref:DNA polymerase III subunit delta n=1 Tax=Candidatus Synechococcus calcipolaris G9 TaxID=1497997 RepID=A0ABT6EYQ0_9SYNE|nr:DNA polymerase III subunit delta [Candidatus Synechococcus calcipolaris]MDG2990273.1 DNA polymerase III subunit delta [Candidatus Synechococcus calcipolaris G9]